MPKRLLSWFQAVVIASLALSLAQCGAPPASPAVLLPTPTATLGATPTPRAVPALATPAAPTATPSVVPTLRAATATPVAPTPTLLPSPTLSLATLEALDAPPGEPAGCLSAQDQDGLASVDAMLGYADQLLALPRPLSSRTLKNAFNGLTGQYLLSGAAGDSFNVISLNVTDVRDYALLQKMLNALHVAGFVAWLRKDPDKSLNILAVPLLDRQVLASDWGPYVQAYWQSRDSLPQGDAAVIPALKLPPCAWMVAKGFAPAVSSWWSAKKARLPDYATPAQVYLAPTTEDAFKSAQRIDWLGPQGIEGPQAMCGPLVWAILHDSGAFPPDLGNWSVGPISFWFAEPRTDGRPWNLFPPEDFHLEHITQPMGTYDFSQYPLYPGDFIFSFSKEDGFDHMFLITEVDDQGNVYTVTNIILTHPYPLMTVERVVVYNATDPKAGIARNRWATDVVNGRTGHDGFDVFRWAWMQKNITGQPVSVTVQPGDTYGLLAERWKTPAELIARYNGSPVSAALRVGETISIPPLEDWRAPGGGE